MPPKALISNILAGGLIGIINCSVAISVAALMFSGTRPEYFTAGISVLLIGTLVTGLGGTLGSGCVRIEKNGTLFKLDADSLLTIQQKHPVAAGQFHSFIVRLLAERLDRANRELQRYARAPHTGPPQRPETAS